MADLGKWLKPYVASTDGLADYSGKIFPVFAPPLLLPPFFTYRRLSGSADKHAGGRTGLKTARLRLNCWGHASGYDQLRALLEKAENRLDGFKGRTPDFEIRRCFVVDEGDELSEPEDASGVPLVGPYLDLEITYAVQATKLFPYPDPPGPPAPTGLTAAGGTGQVSVSWSPSVGALSYDVQRSPDGATWTPAIPVPAGTNYAEAAAPGGSGQYAGLWFFRVRANGAAASSAWTAPVSASPYLVWELWKKAVGVDLYWTIQNNLPCHVTWPIAWYGNSWRIGGTASNSPSATITADGVLSCTASISVGFYAAVNFGATSYTAAATMTQTTPSPSDGGLAVRVQDNLNFYAVDLSPTGALQIYEVASGVYTAKGAPQSVAGYTAGRAYTVSVTVTPTNLAATATDTVSGNTASTSYASTVYQNATFAGVYKGGATATAVTFGPVMITSPAGVPTPPAPPTFATLRVSDTFTAADGTAIAGRTPAPTDVPGTTYSVALLANPSGAATVQGNKAALTGVKDGATFAILPSAVTANGGRVTADGTMHATLGSSFGVGLATDASHYLVAEAVTYPDNAWLGLPLGQVFVISEPVVTPNMSTDQITSRAFFPLALGGTVRLSLYVDETKNPTPYWLYVDSLDGRGDQLVAYGDARAQLAYTGATVLKGGDQPTGPAETVNVDNLLVYSS